MVRFATPADAELVGWLLYDFNTEFDVAVPDAATIGARVGELLEADEITVLLVDSGLAVLRFRADLYSDGLECYLAELYVAPARRGQGLGRALMDAAMEFARERGAVFMDLATSQADVAACALYESCGFTNREGEPDGPLMIFYEREL